MRSVFAVGCLLLGSFASQKHSDPVRVGLPGKNVELAVALTDFRSSGKGSAAGETVLDGTILGGTVRFSFLCDEGTEIETGSRFRKRWTRTSRVTGANPFDTKDWACLDLVQQSPDGGLQDIHYHAFRTLRGIGLHVHVSAGYSGERPTFSRKQFQDLVESIRILDLRIEPAIPAAVARLLSDSSSHKPHAMEWLEDLCKEKPDDFVPHAALGLLAFGSEEPERVLSGCGRAAELLRKKDKLDDDETLLLYETEFTMCWASYQKEHFADALSRAQAAYELAKQLKMADREGDAAYALACAHGELGDKEDTLRFLEEAIEIDPGCKNAVKSSKAFDKFRESPEFIKLLGS